MNQPSKHIVIVAGEASGDMHAANLVQAIRSHSPDITFSGLGGPLMQAQGVEIYTNLLKFAFIGATEWIRHWITIKGIFCNLLDKIDETKPAAVILVDYPGFNLRLAHALKKKDVKVIYYISPKIWAWNEKRIHKIKQYVDKMIVFFPFEVDFYAKHGYTVDFVGNPLVDTIQATTGRDQFLRSVDLSPNKFTIGLLPGSREKEIDNLLPVMLDTAKILYEENPEIQFLLPKAHTIDISLLKKYINGSSLPLKIVDDQTYNAIHASDFCIVTSGTATLETAILNKPMVILYKSALITWALAKLFIKIPHIGLANILAGKEIAPECIQFDATAEKVAQQARDIFTNEIKLANIKEELTNVKNSLGKPGAAGRAAEKILEFIA